jgi:hypothetical protein
LENEKIEAETKIDKLNKEKIQMKIENDLEIKKIKEEFNLQQALLISAVETRLNNQIT